MTMVKAEIDLKIAGVWEWARGVEEARRAVFDLIGTGRAVELVPDSMDRTLFRVELFGTELEEIDDWGDFTESNQHYRLFAWADPDGVDT